MSGLPLRVWLGLVWWYLVRRHFSVDVATSRSNLRAWVLDRIPAEDHPKLFQRAFVRRCISVRSCQVCGQAFEARQDLLSLDLNVTYIRQVKAENGDSETLTEAVPITPINCCSECYFGSMIMVSDIQVRHIGHNGVPGNGQLIMNFVCKEGTKPPASLNLVPRSIQKMVATHLRKLPATRDAQHLLDQVAK